MTRSERRALLALAETVVAPAPPLPPVAATDTLAHLEDYLARSPRPNRLGLRAGIRVLDAAPLLLGARGRLHRLAPERRAAAFVRLERGPLRGLALVVRSLVSMAYYGDTGVMALLGYRSDEVVARGRALRAAEARW